MAFSIRSLASGLGIDRGTQRVLTGSHNVAGSYTTVEVKGLRELEAALNQLPEKVARRELLRAAREGGELFRARAAELAPYNPDVPLGKPDWRTMRLRDGIKKSVSVKSRGAAGSLVRVRIGLDKKHVFFGRYVEKGFIHTGGEQIAPNPFMRPAFEQMKHAALDLFRKVLGEGVAKAARELYRRAA